MKFKVYDLNTINQAKAELGFNPNSLNLTVFLGPGNTAAMISYLTMFARDYYNLSFEQNGLLLIKRSKATNKIIKEDYTFIPNEEIQSIQFKSGLLMHRLFVTDRSGKRTIFRTSRFWLGIPWRTQSVKQVADSYGRQ